MYRNIDKNIFSYNLKRKMYNKLPKMELCKFYFKIGTHTEIKYLEHF